MTYRARDVNGGRDVTVTLCHAAATPNAAAVDRFQDAMLLVAVDHPAVLPTHRVGRSRALAKVAAERFTTLTAFIDTLAGHPARARLFTGSAGTRVFADPAPPGPVPAEQNRPGRPVMLVMAMACIVVLGALITLMLRWPR